MSKIERARQKRFDSAEAHAFLAVVVVAEHFSQAAGDLLMRHGITAEQYNVLRILAGIHPQAYSRREIASRLVRKSPDVTRLLDRVEREGLVERSNRIGRSAVVACANHTGGAGASRSGRSGNGRVDEADDGRDFEGGAEGACTDLQCARSVGAGEASDCLDRIDRIGVLISHIRLHPVAPFQRKVEKVPVL